MRLENSFTVDAPPARVWHAFTDFERVAACMPGAEILERVGDGAYKLRMRLRAGRMTITYRGEVEITERDEAAQTATMRVHAHEARGPGTASATVQSRLAQEGEGTRATMATELTVSGRAASLGQPLIVDLAQAKVARFAENLAAMLDEGSASTDTGTALVAGAAEPAEEAAPAAASDEPRAPAEFSEAPTQTPAASSEAQTTAPAVAAESYRPSATPTLDADLAQTADADRLRDPRVLALGALLVFVLGFLVGRARGAGG